MLCNYKQQIKKQPLNYQMHIFARYKNKIEIEILFIRMPLFYIAYQILLF